MPYCRSDALGCFTLGVAGKHAVDVGIVSTPEALFGIDGVRVRTGDHHDLPARYDSAVLLQTLQPCHQPGTAVQLLILIAAHAADDAQRLLALAKGVSGHTEVVAVNGFNFKQGFLLHGYTPPFCRASSMCPRRMRAISDP